ncbi:MAG: hypothetical protein HFH41_11455 [Lachnospiraceae bacterium]|nr:hypothetical protein [Lachnospiraceae bacterium]
MRNENSKIQIPNVDKGYTKRKADELLSSLQTDIILLNAGAGYGKTQLLAHYVRHFPGKSAWYSIGDTDNDLMSFVQNFTKSVQNALNASREDFCFSAPLLENIDILMEQLIIWLDARIDFLNVILDDFQEITNPDIFNLLEILIETMDKKIRLFVVEKRSLPTFFEKYIAGGQAFCMGTEDLKFNQEEISLLLENMGAPSQQWTKLIYDCTEGWPVGIAQIMLQLKQQKKNVTLESLKKICENLEISDYFMTRVYKMLPFDIQTFLKKTAVLDYMTPSICNKIVGIHNSESMLRYLANEKLFVQTLGDISSLYRYHSIFRRFLLSQTPLEEQQESLQTAACFLLKTNDKIQAAEYACQGKSAHILQTVIEVSGDSMLEDRLYATLERWFAFLAANHCELTPKTKFIYGKYLMALGNIPEAHQQIEEAKKEFYEKGRLLDYQKVLLFAAAAKRKAGCLLEAEKLLTQALENQNPQRNEIREAVRIEQVKIKCCFHQLKEALVLLSDHSKSGGPFGETNFLSAARQILTILTQKPEEILTVYQIRTEHIPEGFLLGNCILAQQMKTAYLSEDYQSVRKIAKEMIQSSEHETLQTAAAWEMLAVLSWEEGDYRKAVEQSRTGTAFLFQNHINHLGFIPKHQQILKEIRSIHQNTSSPRYLIARQPETSSFHQKTSGKIKIQCMDCFCVFLPDSEGKEMKWRTKKARELFAYLFHLQGKGVSKEVLIELLWPEAGIKSAIALFHTTLYSIRQSFVQEGLEDLISYEDKKYSLNMQLVDSDLKELLAFFKNPKAWEEHPEQIMQLYSGNYMGNSGYLWSYGMAKELENEYFNILKAGAAKRTAQNLPESALPFLQRILEADPYNEEVVSQLILCLYQSGRQSQAKQQYDRTQKLYQEDLELNFTKTFKEIVDGSDL